MKVELQDDDLLLGVYDDELDEVGDTVIAGRPYPTSEALKQIDPIAYRGGYLEWLDGYLRENPDVRHIDFATKGVHYWVCPECGDAYNDATEANECCS